MRALIYTATAFSIVFTANVCQSVRGASATGNSSGSTPDPNATTIANLCRIACGKLPCCCKGPCHHDYSIAARLSAIDTLGTFKTSSDAVTCLKSLLSELCCHHEKKHCACEEFDRTMLAMHAIQALSSIGPGANIALPEISASICISDDLAGAVASAIAVIQAPASPTAAKPSDPTKDALDQILLDLTDAQEHLYEGPEAAAIRLKFLQGEVKALEASLNQSVSK